MIRRRPYTRAQLVFLLLFGAAVGLSYWQAQSYSQTSDPPPD